MAKSIVFFDTEIDSHNNQILDIGAIDDGVTVYHSSSVAGFAKFAENAEYLCGHNALHFDLAHLVSLDERLQDKKIIDTLYLSPLLFPKKPYHRLLKDDKLFTEELNNPVNDSKKARDLFNDEIVAFTSLSSERKKIYYALLNDKPEFKDFFDYLNYRPFLFNLKTLIRNEFSGLICEHAEIDILIQNYKVELAYSLALIGTRDRYSITPPWLFHNYPQIDNVINILCGSPCIDGCKYCDSILDVKKGLKNIFGFDDFRTFPGDDRSLQEDAARAAIEGKSLLAVFPTGGGKSITFQLPALILGNVTHGLTVVISPLQSLMKDQVDNLAAKGIDGAITINGLLNPIERAAAIEEVQSGKAAILYISPEQFRSNTIERLLMSRNIVRFVIDEAHCFSAWGQDFRVDYLFIADFIKKMQKAKGFETGRSIPVSCFTATAKQKVISDIRDYFNNKLGLNLELLASKSTRRNLHYVVLHKDTDDEKYLALRSIIEQKKCPTIVYVSRTRLTERLSQKLTADGFTAIPYNGQMESSDKNANQDAFMSNKVQIMVATSAFGMGVDKSDVKLVIHYDISDSLENYVQEAGRAGRDQSLEADCYVLFNDNDLDKHFVLLNQTKLSISQIQQVWKAIKNLTQNRSKLSCSALEIAREAGWNDDRRGMVETQVKTAILALENAGYIVRGNNVPRIFASSISVKNVAEASTWIRNSEAFDSKHKEDAIRIIKSLISSRSISTAGNAEAESRIDYLSAILAIPKGEVINSVNLMRQEGLLSDYNDMTAFIGLSDNQHKSSLILDRFVKLERFILSKFKDETIELNLKELNEEAQNNSIVSSNLKNIRTILYFLTIKNYIIKQPMKGPDTIEIAPALKTDEIIKQFEKRISICRFILSELYEMAEKEGKKADENDYILVEFSLVGIHKAYIETPRIDFAGDEVTISDTESAFLYLSKIGALKLEGGFLVLYNAMTLTRLVKDNRIKYKLEDYKLLDEFYKQKIRQIHIVGEYANLMVRDYSAALKFVNDYFNLDFKQFISTYFKGNRVKEIERNITPGRFNQLFGDLSTIQSDIINDNSKYIVVAAGPGSGKTRVLVHKLASLYQLEDVKHDQMLMLTFSRAAAIEFKKRLIQLIGASANFIEIKTFHSYCFDLLGRIGSIEASGNVVKDAAEKIRNGEVEPEKITKTVLVIDEAQDMDRDEYDLVTALMTVNEEMRIIAVGDDDQNIYEFRGSNSVFLKSFIEEYGAHKYEMVENYRSATGIVKITNAFAETLSERMKTSPIVPITNTQGSVVITKHYSPYMEEAVVNELLSTHKKGTVCILTNTNEEALRITGLLIKRGKHAKLIQSNDGFRLYDIVEIRAFLKTIFNTVNTPEIPKENWNSAKKRIFDKYSQSKCLEQIIRIIEDFELSHDRYYKTDFEEYLYESKLEDFYGDTHDGIVYVSTIHKSKGREFDSVFLMLSNSFGIDDAERRKIYVGLSRAKNNLYIHCNTDLFDDFIIPEINRKTDQKCYTIPDEITIQTTHKDVVLNYSKYRKDQILSLVSGYPLEVGDGYLKADIGGRSTPVAKFSAAFNDKLQHYSDIGYVPVKASIRFIVAWKPEDEDGEYPVILSDISLRKAK